MIVSTISALILALIYSYSSAMMIYYSVIFTQCLLSSYRSGKRDLCWYLGLFMISLTIISVLGAIMYPESFTHVLINPDVYNETPSAADQQRVAAIGDLGQENYSPISGLGTSHRLEDVE